MRLRESSGLRDTIWGLPQAQEHRDPRRPCLTTLPQWLLSSREMGGHILIQNNHNCSRKLSGKKYTRSINISESRITNGSIYLSVHMYIYMHACNIYLYVYQLFTYVGYLKAFGPNVFVAKLS